MQDYCFPLQVMFRFITLIYPMVFSSIAAPRENSEFEVAEKIKKKRMFRDLFPLFTSRLTLTVIVYLN